MSPLRFRIRLYRSYKYHDTLAGLITQHNQMYFYAHDLARFLKPKKPHQWISKMTNKLVFKVDPDPILKNHAMMHSRMLMDILKQKPNFGRSYYLLRIVEGTDHVHYKGMHLKQHLLDACPCAATDGVSFVEWAESEKRKMDMDLEFEHTMRHKNMLAWMEQVACDTTCPEAPADFMDDSTDDTDCLEPADFMDTLKEPTDPRNIASTSKASTVFTADFLDSPNADFLDSPNADFLKGPMNLGAMLEVPTDKDTLTELEKFSTILQNVIKNC